MAPPSATFILTLDLSQGFTIVNKYICQVSERKKFTLTVVVAYLFVFLYLSTSTQHTTSLHVDKKSDWSWWRSHQPKLFYVFSFIYNAFLNT